MTKTKDTWEKVKEMNISLNFSLGPINGESLLKDPKHFGFVLSRYKFAAKMLKNCKHIIDIGCGEGLGELVFQAETCAKITGIDFDEDQINYSIKQVLPHTKKRVNFICQDLINEPYKGEGADGLACIDVIEHIHLSEEEQFLKNCLTPLEKGGIAVFGTPNKLATTQYTNPRNQKGHINSFDPNRLISTLERHLSKVFLFSMNDEIVHVGHMGWHIISWLFV